MSEVAPKSAFRTLPLDDVHRRSGAEMSEHDGWALPEDYGDVAAEYAAVRSGAGLIDLSARGRIVVGGSEAVMFLNGLITNDIKTLAQNSWMPAAFPNVQGRLLAAVRVINRGDDFLIDTESATLQTVLKLLERFAHAGDFRVAEVTNETAMLSVQGKEAETVVRATLGDPAAEVGRQKAVAAKLSNDSGVTVIRATHTAEDGFDLFVDASAAQLLWDGLLKAGATPVGSRALEILRVEAGIPRYGIDMDETNVVTEANLDDAVSFTKGCYVGQEIIARIKYRGHVAKKLTGLVLERESTPERGAKIFSSDDKEIGRVTSAVFSLSLKRTVALGFVKYDYLMPGTQVKVAAVRQRPAQAKSPLTNASSSVPAHVAELPFLRGSWYSNSNG